MSDLSGFAPGFASRHDAAATAAALARAFGPPEDFAPIESIVRAPAPRPRPQPRGFEPQPAGPKHFSPADPDSNPTEGWDIFEAAPEAPPQPFVDPVAAAHAAGFVEGHDSGRAEAGAEFARDRALVERLAEALAGESRVDRDRLAGHLRATVLHLVRQLVGELGVAPERLEARIASAVDLISDSAEASVLRLHPDDLSLVEKALPTSVFAAADATIGRGSFVLESATTVVEDGPELWLEQLADVIDHAPLPTPC